jgi:hypothetical protein
MAAKGHSKQHTADLMGISIRRLRKILSTMDPVEWPGPGRSLLARVAYENRRGSRYEQFTDAQLAFMAKRKAEFSHTVRGVTGTINDLVKRFGAEVQIGCPGIRRRLARGMTAEQALFSPPSKAGMFGSRPPPKRNAKLFS